MKNGIDEEIEMSLKYGSTGNELRFKIGWVIPFQLTFIHSFLCFLLYFCYLQSTF